MKKREHKAKTKKAIQPESEQDSWQETSPKLDT